MGMKNVYYHIFRPKLSYTTSKEYRRLEWRTNWNILRDNHTTLYRSKDGKVVWTLEDGWVW